jgi:hypothetical protein
MASEKRNFFRGMGEGIGPDDQVMNPNDIPGFERVLNGGKTMIENFLIDPLALK